VDLATALNVEIGQLYPPGLKRRTK
jgi:hypothetical protein